MITSFNTPVRELDGHIFVEVEELYKRDEIIEDLNNQLRQEKDAYNRMYNMYVEKDNIIKELEQWLEFEYKHILNNKNYKFVLNKIKELKGSDKE